MRFFTSAFIVAALATLGSAAPVDLLPRPASEVKSAVADIHARSVNSKISDAPGSIQSVLNTQAVPSVAAIFSNILTQIQPHTTKLTYMTASNSSVTDIQTTVTLIKAPLTAAVPQLQALVDRKASVVLAPAHPVAGDAELTVSDIATIVAVDINLVLAAAGRIIDVTNAMGGNIVTEVQSTLLDLSAAVSRLVNATEPLVDGLSASLVSMVDSPRSLIQYDHMLIKSSA